MFSINLVALDSYQAPPIPSLDVAFSDFRGADIKQLPVVRIFGSTLKGEKTCLHIHGVFPYIYIPCTVDKNTDSYSYRLASALDAAINTSFGSTTSTNQHVYKIQLVSGIPIYGYHNKEHLFFKIYFYNPAIVKRAADLLQNGAVLNQSMQPHEAHIPFILQFMIDYNLYGMSLINLKTVKFRQQDESSSRESSQSNSRHLSDTSKYLPVSVLKQSTCKLEVDARACDILNREEILKGLELNPGIAAIWNNEKARRDAKEMPHPESELLFSNTAERRVDIRTDNDIFQEERLAKRLELISQTDSSLSTSGSIFSYPIEKEDEFNLLNASHVLNHFKPHESAQESIEEALAHPLTDLNITDLSQLTSHHNKTADSSVLDPEDMQLLDMLVGLAEDNSDQRNVDDDSVLGSQTSALSKDVQEENEADDVENLNITCLDLDSLSSWNSFSKPSSQSSVHEAGKSDKNTERSTKTSQIIDETLINLPQYDGSNDTLFIQCDKQKKYQTLKKGNSIPLVKCRNLNLSKIYELDHQDLDVYDPDDTNWDINAPLSSNVYQRTQSSKKSYAIHDSLLNVKIKKLLFLPALDGNTLDSSSDSECDPDITIQREENRICAYKQSTISGSKQVIANTPGKKPLSEVESDLQSPRKRRKTNFDNPQTSLDTPTKYCTPKKPKTPRSPHNIFAKYTPLDVTITSPKRCLEAANSPPQEPQSPKSSISGSIRPRQRNLRINLLREKSGRLSPKRTDGHTEETNTSLPRHETNEDDDQGVNSDTGSNSSHVSLTQYSPKSTKEVRKRLSFISANEAMMTSMQNPYDENHYDDLPLAERIINQSSDKLDKETSTVNIHLKDDHNLPSTSKHGFSYSDPDSVDTILLTEDENVEIDSDNNEDVCNMTFTQCISKKLGEANQSFSLQNISDIGSQKSVTIVTKFNPPTRRRIIDSMNMYNIAQCKFKRPYFSNNTDLVKLKESGNSSSNTFMIDVFKSGLDGITGIKLWRRMKVNEFHPSGSSIKTCNMKRALSGYTAVTIHPVGRPPSPKHIKNWLKAKQYLMKQIKTCVDSKTPTKAKNNNEVDLQVTSTNSEWSGTSETCDIPDKAVILQEKIQDKSCVRNFQNSSISQYSISSNELNPSLQKILENPLLYKDNQTPQQLGISYGQIEYSIKGASRNIDDENFQNARALAVYQYLTVLSVEVHILTREDLLPDPEHDPIEAIFYAIHDDVPKSVPNDLEHGAIIVNRTIQNQRLKNMYSAAALCSISYVATETDLINSLITLLRHCDPDILVGWEIESLSWGYIFQRATRIGFKNITWQFSRVPNVAPKSTAQTLQKDSFNDPKVPGRIVLDVWRIMRHETALLNYTFENVMYRVMHERIACPTFKTLTAWWKNGHIAVNCRVIHHYVIRTLGTLRILLQLDAIGRTCEHARLIGIQFYEVFSRGSQFRVESMMLRLAKPLNYIPVSPSVQQRAKMRAPEGLPLIMEPESILYTDPVIVLDFQSLYPSIIIAYNYCFSTCLGRIEHIGQYEPFEFGAATLRVKKSLALRLRGKVNFSPCGVAFVKKEVRQGILPRMLTEILNTRLMVKESMKLHGSTNTLLQKVLDSQQLGLKLIANVTYGYTAANFSGRMPCIEIGDSVVSKGRETLERAIKIVQSTPKWGAQVVYGDTDSLFLLLPGKSKEDAFKIGAEIADTVTAANPPPVKLKFEKVLHPSILQTKKRYCGYMYESPDQKEPEYLAKGIETVRRDGCPAVAKILEKSLKLLFDTKDVSLIKRYVTRQFDKILRRRISMQDLTFAREFRGLSGYKASACVPALELTRRLMRKDPRAIPRTGERVRYVIVAGAPNQALIQCVRTPTEVMQDEGLVPNSIYYITKVIIPPLNRCFNLFGIDVNMWYREMSHRQTPDKAVSLFADNQKSTIRQFFSTIVCAACGGTTKKEICSSCMSRPSQTITILHEKIRWLERTYHGLTTICQSCTGYTDDPRCESLDCPVLYRRAEAHRDLIQVPYLTKIITDNMCD